MKKLFTLAALGSVMSYGAVINVYNNSGSFNSSSVVSPQTGTEGVNAPTFTEQFNNATSSIFNFNFTGGTQIGGSRGISGGVLLDQVDDNPVQSTGITLISGQNMVAVGANFDFSLGLAGQGLLLRITFLDNTTQDILVNGSGPNQIPFGGAGFFGITSDTAFSSVTLMAQSTINPKAFQNVSIDNLVAEVSGGTNPPPPPPPPPGVPEPATFGMMGLAMVGLGVARKLRS